MALAGHSVSLLLMLADQTGRSVDDVIKAYAEVAQLARHELDLEEGGEG
jgi:hypothetical protein